MERLSAKYEKKLIDQNLVESEDVVFGERDRQIQWNRRHPLTPSLEKIFNALNINALLFSKPAEPYRSIIEYLADEAAGAISLKDNETRTFLHDIPVIDSLDPEKTVKQLKQRKCAVIKGGGIVAHGTVGPEQAFIYFSSVLFSCFVKFFVDCLSAARRGLLSPKQALALDRVRTCLRPFPEITFSLRKGPFVSEHEAIQAVCEAGKPVVRYGLVDSVMGNISCRFKDVLYISQTGSFLDELEHCIDACPLDNSSCAGITASSELPTHLQIVKTSSNRAVLHGHPKFSVIMSMSCEKEEHCPRSGQCHIKCPENRYLRGIPIVGGESGAGRRAIVNTVPQAVKAHQAAIVYGHGVFTAAADDFNSALAQLWNIERMCREEYFNRLEQAIS